MIMKNRTSPSDLDSIGSGVKALLHAMILLFGIAKIALVLLFCSYMVSGIFTVPPNEQAFILRFGALVSENGTPVVFGPGNWYWAWPKPIEKVVRVPVKQAKSVSSSSFWRNEKNIFLTEPSTLTENQPLEPGLDGYLLTGDKNILHTKWSLSYLISDPIKYFINHKFPENTIRYTLDSSILKVVATTPIEKALYQGAEELRLNVLKQVKPRLHQLNLGIVVTNVSLPKKEPPQSTIPDFSAVIEAEQKRSQAMTEAQGYAEKIAQKALGMYSKTIAKAEGYRNRIISSVEADKEYFLKILQEYQKAPETMLLTLHSNVMNEVLSKVNQKFIIHTAGEGVKQEIRLLMNHDRFLKRKGQPGNPLTLY